MTSAMEQRLRLKDKPVRVLHVIPHLAAGGSERVLLTLLGNIDKSKYTSMLCVLGSINAFPRRIDVERDPVFLGYRGSLRDIRGMSMCLSRLRGLIRQFDPDIIHSHLWPACRLTSAAGLGFRAKHVYHIHDTRPWLIGRSAKDFFLRQVTAWLSKLSNATMITVSEAVKQYTCKNLSISHNNVIIIHNGVNLKEFDLEKYIGQSVIRQRMIIGMVALIKPEKGHKYIIEAVKKVIDHGMDVELRLAGTGSLKSLCIQQCKELGLSDKVHFYDLVEDVPEFLGKLDLLVLPSVFGEGLPMTVLEGMAMGLPIVATPISGTPEAIEDGKDGLLVPPRDAEALARAIELLVRDPELRSLLGQNAHIKARKLFSLEKTVENIERVYDDLTNRDKKIV